MCLLCDDAGDGAGAVSLTERPAHALHGTWWEGSHAEAAKGAVRDVIRRVKAHSDARRSAWKSPIVGLSWNDRPDGFRYFVGIAPEEGEALPAGFDRLDLAAMELASAWHGPADGEVVAHYGRMIEWLRNHGLAWNTAAFHHREEYPHDVDPDAPPRLRLLLPIARTAPPAAP